MTATNSIDGTISNAIAFAQVRLRGGWKNLASTGGLYGLAVAGTLVAAVRFIDQPPAQVYLGALRIMLGFQLVLLLLAGGSRVSAAIRSDLTTRMIESHRLMPFGPGRAVAGYLFGAPSQALALALVTLLVGVPAAAGAGVPVVGWLWSNAVVGLFAGLVWAALAYLSFLVRSPFAWAVMPTLVLWSSQGWLLTAVPALGVLAGPVVGPTVFAMAGPAGPTSNAYAASALAQVVVGGVLFAAARRRYARDGAVGMSPELGLVLLATLAAASWAGTALAPEFRPAFVRGGRSPGVSVQLVCSLLLLMLVALSPVAAAARLEDLWRRARARDPDGGGRPPLPVPLVALAAGALAAALPGALLATADRGDYLPRRFAPDPWVARDLTVPWATTAAIVMLALVAFGYAVRAARQVTRPGRPVALGWFVLAWAGPVVGDALRMALTSGRGGSGGDALGYLTECSPGGAVVLVWLKAFSYAGGGDPPVTGLAVQAGVVAVTATLYHVLASRRPVPAAR